MGKKFGDAERKYIDQVMDSELLASHYGTMVKSFEEKFAERMGVKYAVAMNSAMSCLHGALAAVGVGPGDEVICDPIVHFGAAAVMYNNAIPVFADVDYKTFQIDPESIEERITECTRAILCTHLFGLCCDMDRIMEIAQKHNLAVIEDSCQAITATCGGKLAGTMGDIGVFSFEQSKHITSGDGGIAITNDRDLADEMKKMRIIGWVPEEARAVSERWKQGRLGWNFRMTELCGAVLLGQLEKLDSVIEDYISKAQSYREVLEDCGWLVPQYVPEGYKHAFWVVPYLFEGEKNGIALEDFQRVAKEEKVSLSVGYTKVPANMIGLFTEPRAYGKGCPTHCPLYAGEVHYGPGVCPVAEDILPRIVLLWCEPEDLARVVKKIEGDTK